MVSLGKVIYYTYTFDEILLQLFLLSIVIFLPLILINYIIFLKNIMNKVAYINLAYNLFQDDIIISLVLTSKTAITGRLCRIGFDSLILSHNGFKGIIHYKKIEFIETKIER
jgi:hypothetical protein